MPPQVCRGQPYFPSSFVGKYVHNIAIRSPCLYTVLIDIILPSRPRFFVSFMLETPPLLLPPPTLVNRVEVCRRLHRKRRSRTESVPFMCLLQINVFRHLCRTDGIVPARKGVVQVSTLYLRTGRQRKIQLPRMETHWMEYYHPFVHTSISSATEF